MKTAEVVIVGGGVAGASIAWHLAERGCTDVLVLDRSASLGEGSTGKATGGIRAQFETDINVRMSLYSLDFFRDWDFDAEYDPKGYLFLATNNLHLEYLSRTGDRQRELGYDSVHLVTQDEIAAIVPGMNVDDVVGGSFGPRDGFINPLAVLEGFVVGASQRGMRVVTGTEVQKIKVDDGRVTGVVTKDGQIDCEKAVIASGAWARQLALSAGIDLLVTPLRRQIVWARTPEPLPADLPMVIDLKDGFHFRPAMDFSHGSSAQDPNAVLFAWPDPDEPPSFSTKFDDGFLDKVGERAFHRAPFLAGSQIVYEKCRAGLYENSPDHHAILGGCEIDGLYFANGFSGHGVMHSPATGRALAEIILDGEASFLDVSSLSIERFAKGELLHEAGFI
ncbi:MAG TPA: FAD-binding oxidoreductase [Pyrinomonadaceae bacterium]|jgi:sarcosine oxidase subunit beta|nr:FAD-binding oxidoreductase [Pyrinomonadaceae bacterium]